MTTTIRPYRSRQQAVRDGFAELLRSEWTKFRTVRGWVIAMCAAALVTAVAPIELGVGAHNNNSSPTVATGPAGDAVTDDFYFVHQPLAGNGSITVRVSSLHGTGPESHPPNGYAPFPRTQPWAKAGLIVKASDKPGSPYAAMMVTAGHGVRMQYDFTHDIAGPPGAVSVAAPRWLRLTRSGDTLTGYASTDGTHWTEVGTAHLAALPSTVQAGLFAASPDYNEANQTFGGNNNGVQVPSQAAATLGQVRLTGSWPAHSWAGVQIGRDEGTPTDLTRSSSPHGQLNTVKPGRPVADHFGQAAGTFSLTGSGDIAPYEAVTDPLLVCFYGTLIGLVVVIALGAMFITTEFRRGLIRSTLAASPRRPRVLAAKALVAGSVTFVAALIGAVVAFPIAQHMLNRGGWTAPVYRVIPLFSTTGLRIVLGTAGLLALAAVLALAVGAVLRRGAGAVTTVIALVVFPLVLAVVLPLGPANWLMRLTPAAAFSVQQSLPQYSQVSHSCLPYNGCYPLAPWAGFGVLCLWVLATLAGAMVLLRRRDV
jgi:ABC-type transport system involved in multi-copper enzyme maturation permease subunit